MIDVTNHQWMPFIVSELFSGLVGVMLVTLGGNVNPRALGEEYEE